MCAKSRNVVRVISDLHLGAHWHTKANSNALTVCLEECAMPETHIHSLVIAGDVFEQWLVPYNEAPPSCLSVMQQAAVLPFVDLVKKVIANDVKVYFIRGNHDDELDTASLREVFGESLIIVEGEEVCFNGIRFQHGHAYDILSQPYEGAKKQRPVSYYLSRLAAHSGNMLDRPTVSWLTLSLLIGNRISSTLMPLFYFKPVPLFFLRGVMSIAFKASWSQIKDEQIVLRNGESVVLSEIVSDYADMLYYAKERYGMLRAAAMFRMSMSGNVGHWMRRSPYLLEVAGHSHIPVLRSYMRYKSLLSDGTKAPRTLPTKVIYANSGSFTGGESTYVDILLARTSHEVGWRSYLPPYLFGLEHPHDNRSFYDNYKGEALPVGLAPHTWDRSGSINDPARLTQQESGVAAGTVVPYEVRMVEWRDGGFYIRKAKRVPYRFDPTSFNRRVNKINAYDVAKKAATQFDEDSGHYVGVPVTGPMDESMWERPSVDRQSAENRM
ncbi:Calcineurin-like phosphoesterase superfamily domain [Carpediemonas membranifera]|uniref:Calcineurin-like phosphoesterase superfamily domain n=1 Tax=Carpediemonas membranifera TaxID=201153 RepID=A0A8J6B4E4_9EUKA|nr:Calcineurin-like phosphoesterase superfamily domain [Carpediemonas membranifera]|eukprot:KAG9394084.1 Calcineurin-like phosphoesterase superfamily domain [Carpediemonas membranifera]